MDKLECSDDKAIAYSVYSNKVVRELKGSVLTSPRVSKIMMLYRDEEDFRHRGLLNKVSTWIAVFLSFTAIFFLKGAFKRGRADN